MGDFAYISTSLNRRTSEAKALMDVALYGTAEAVPIVQ